MQEVSFKGGKVHVDGSLPEAGSKAADFELVDQNLNPVSLNSLGSQKKLLNVYVSLDTSVCAASVHSFEQKRGVQFQIYLFLTSVWTFLSPLRAFAKAKVWKMP